jgi:hypothetical protein
LQDQPYEISNEEYIEATCAMFVRAYLPVSQMP